MNFSEKQLVQANPRFESRHVRARLDAVAAIFFNGDAVYRKSRPGEQRVVDFTDFDAAPQRRFECFFDLPPVLARADKRRDNPHCKKNGNRDERIFK